VENSGDGSCTGCYPLLFYLAQLHISGNNQKQHCSQERHIQRVPVLEGLAVHEDGLEYVHIWPRASRHIQRTVRRPRYSDHELIPFFTAISQGYCVNQSADKCLYPRKWVWNTLYSDDDTLGHMLDRSMEAGAKIRMGLMAPPLDRYDGLWDKYIGKSLTI
jgi:hypothetical protein